MRRHSNARHVSRELRVQSKQRRGVLNWMMDRNLNLLINSAILVICLICAGGGAEDASRTRVRSAWGKFNELAPVLTKRGVSLKLKGKIYDACVQRVLVYGITRLELWKRETWLGLEGLRG